MKFNVSIMILSVFTCTSLFSVEESSAPFISGDSFRFIANHTYDESNYSIDLSKINNGDIIFVRTECLDDFFEEIHSKITKKYILITHNSDLGAPGKFYKYLDDSNLIAWFGAHPTHVHSKFTPLPLGIPNRYCRLSDSLQLAGNLEHFLRIKKLCKAKKIKKENLLVLNFNPPTVPKERVKLFNDFEKKKFCKNALGLGNYPYLLEMAKSKFVLCPRGNGLDCYRPYEALYVNCIPIVKSSLLNPVFQGLPVVIVQDWNEVTQVFLEKKYKEFKKRKFRKNKLLFSYWQEMILRQKQCGITS